MADRKGQEPTDPLYSLAHLTLINCTPTELVYIAARVGYDAISPRLIQMYIANEFKPPPLDKAQVRATKIALASTGIRVQEIEIANITEDCTPRDFESALEIGAELGAKRLVTSAWTKGHDDRNFIIDTYAATCDLAEPYGLSVDLEFPTFSRLPTLGEALDIVRAADRSNSGILIDTLYIHLSRIDLDAILSVPQEWLHALQIADCLPGVADTREGMIQLARDARLYPGEGCIDLAGIIERCPPVSYSIELPNQSRIAELGYEEHARRCLIHAKRTFGAVRSKRDVNPQTHTDAQGGV